MTPAVWIKANAIGTGVQNRSQLKSACGRTSLHLRKALIVEDSG